MSQTITTIVGAFMVGAALFRSANPAEPQPNWRETQWSAHLAERVDGQAEYRLPDGSRIDILTDKTAWEVEWCHKWEEAIGQAAFYGLSTDRAPGVWLLMKPGEDEDYLRCLMVCRHYGIRLKVEAVR